MSFVANRPPDQPRVAHLDAHVDAGATSGTIHDETGDCGVAPVNNAGRTLPGQRSVVIPGATGNWLIVNVPTVLAVAGTQGVDALLLIGVAYSGPGRFSFDLHSTTAAGLLTIGSTNSFFVPGAAAVPSYLARAGTITIDPGGNGGSFSLQLARISIDPKTFRISVDPAAPGATMTGTFTCVDLTQT